MKTLLSNALGFVKERANLVFGYALIAALITLGGFTLTLWMRNATLQVDVANLNTNLVSTQGKVTTLESAKAIQDETITTLRKLRERDSEMVSNLQTDLNKIRGTSHATRDRVNDLEKRSEKVKNYLDVPLPVELQCVLNSECPTANHPGTEDGDRNTSKVAQNSVRRAR